MEKTRTTARRLAAAVTICAGALGGAAAAQGWAPPTPASVPHHGLDFVTVGAPGNRPAWPSERALNLNPPLSPHTADIGDVPYEYRIARTEITTTQWVEFLDVYWHVWDAAGNQRFDTRLTGLYIVPNTTDPTVRPRWTIRAGGERFPTTMTWELAAQYCNWLHNGKPSHGPGGPGTNVPASVFASGAYDVATFTRNPDGSYNHQQSPSPGALFWVPSLDEWTKAAYYDPNRYGPGQDGYWLFPHGSNTPPVGGPPGQGQSSTQGYSGPMLPVGSYPGTRSPWGLLDASGGEREWTGTAVYPVVNQYGLVSRNGETFIMGSGLGGFVGHDLIDDHKSENVGMGTDGLRIASAIPSPGASAALILLAFSAGRRRSR